MLFRSPNKHWTLCSQSRNIACPRRDAKECEGIPEYFWFLSISSQFPLLSVNKNIDGITFSLRVPSRPFADNFFLRILQQIFILFILTTSAAATPTTAPVVHEIKLADAIPLNKLQTEDRETNLTDKLTKPQAEETTYFGEIDEYGDDESPIASLPIIALHTTELWKALPLGGEGLQNAGWKYVAAGPAPREIWGALDTVAGTSRATFVLAHSTNGGETFQLTVFHKPCKLAQFFDFAMSRDGHGRATVSLSADCGTHKAGLYHFETTDDGKNWSPEPRYEPDVMIRADEVPDEEQPDESSTGKTASPTLYKTRTSATN